MVIPFNKKQNKAFLYLAITFTLLGLIFFITSSWKGIPRLLLLVPGLSQTLTYFQSKKGYIKIEEGTLSVNRLSRWKRISLNEVLEFKRFANGYIFKNNGRKVKLYLNGMASENIEILDSELAKYKINI